MSRVEAIKKVKNWQAGHSGFSSRFLDFYCSADVENRGKLRLGFPELAAAYEDWFAADDPEVFFQAHLGEGA